jgi:hypothetical protein
MITFIQLICDNCNKNYTLSLANYSSAKNKKVKHHFCSQKCNGEFKSRTHTVVKNCDQCGKQVEKIISKVNDKRKKSSRCFCSRSCSVTYNNTHKTRGTRISKLEKYISENLTKEFNNLKIHFNHKEAINSELDIYIPSLKLAFELNGIFHYEPIYGKEKLSQIQNNDKRKFQACLEKNIELCLIDASSIKHFTKERGKKYYEIVKEHILLKLNIDKAVD